jgi:tyrosyl-tRNA synthetase
MNVMDEFLWREMVYDSTEALRDTLATEKVKAYIGFDPTAKSLHVGSLLPVMALARMQRAGHSPIAIVGGGTGLIGDPSGKIEERQLLTKEQVETNLSGIREQLSHFLDFEAKENPAKIINNAEWLIPIRMMDFLRDIGKYFKVNTMLSRESVKRRLEQAEGISFTEFSYMLLQAYDFLILFDRLGCTLQMGGSDQWGNIVGGIELIRRLRSGKAHGLVFPLVTSATGVKFGKTEAGAVWLDPQLTSPFRFYQFWLNTDDRDVIKFLKYFTWLSQHDIEALKDKLKSSPETREPQRALAREVTRVVHGESALDRVEIVSSVLFGEALSNLKLEEILDIFGDVPSTSIDKSQLEGAGLAVSSLIVMSGLASSKAEARRLIQQGGIYLNNRRVTNAQQNIALADSIEGRVLVLRKGAKQYHLIQL